MGKLFTSDTVDTILATDFIDLRRDDNEQARGLVSTLVTFLSTAFTTLSGLTSVAATTFTGNLVGGVKLPLTSTAADTIAVGASDSGRIYIATKTSATQVFTLPAVSAGLVYTFMCGNAGGEILIDQAANEVITITSFAAVGVDADTGIIATAAGTGIKNTAGSNAVGDCITLFSNGTGWYTLGITSGIWASQ